MSLGMKRCNTAHSPRASRRNAEQFGPFGHYVENPKIPRFIDEYSVTLRASEAEMRAEKIGILLGFFALPLLSAQTVAPVAKTELAEITRRGRHMTDYEQAARYSRQALKALNPEPGRAERQICQQTGKTWAIAFGKLNEQKDKFLVAYLAEQGKNARTFVVKPFDPPQEDTGFFLHAALAIARANADFGRKDRPYDAFVLPAANGQLFVYLLPSPIKEGVLPLGGDVRYVASADGASLLEKRLMHEGVLESTKAGPNAITVVLLHEHVLSEGPEDSDVFYVLRQEQPFPLTIVTGSFMYKVREFGNIDFLGKRVKFGQDKKKN